jgi:hypothetical protein
MKNLFGKFIFLVIISFAFVFSASAWDDTGHKLTTYIAWEQMSPTAREKAIKILLAAPEDSDLSVFYLQDSRSAAAKQRELFMIASTWADIVRDKNFKNRFAMYHKGDWHYADTFWSNANGKVEVLKDFAEPKGKAVEQLFAFDKSLRDAAVSEADKAIALAWVLHLGGDIHQPLHTSARVTQYDPKGDQGGNLFSLSPKGATGNDRVSLHWYWDSIVGRNIARVNDACDSDYLPAIAKQITGKYPVSKMQNRLKLGKFDEWQQEGFQISSTKLYPESLKFGEMPSDDYKKMAFNISEEQIALAGYRMGAMLNQIFDIEVTREEYDKHKSKYEKDAGIGVIGKGADDSWLWFKTRAALITAEGLRDSIINFEVENSVITLNGTVLNETQKEKAVSTVKSIDGVKAVKNFLKIASK